MAEWPLTRLGEIAQLFDAPHQTAPTTLDGPVVYLNVGDIRNGRIELRLSGRLTNETAVAWTKRVVPRPGDVVFGYEATVGDAAVLIDDYPLALGRRVGLLRPDPERVDPRFLTYSWYAPRFQEILRSHRVGGTTIESIRLTELPNWTIPLPSIAEQRRIAGKCGALDDKIELNRRMSETLEATARALFKSWFVDFDPVRAKVEGRDPCLQPHLAVLFPGAFADSELGEIPQGWRVSSIGDLAQVVGGSTPRTDAPAFWDGGHHCWATPRDLSRLSTPVLLDTDRRITEAGLAQIGSGLLPAGTVLLSSRAPIGYLAIAEIPVAINQGFIAMRPSAGVPSTFLLYWAASASDEIVSRANGSTFLEISKANFRPIPVVTPPAPILTAFDQVVRPTYSRIVANERETRTLKNIRDALLPRLISGELRLTGADRLVEAVSA